MKGFPPAYEAFGYDTSRQTAQVSARGCRDVRRGALWRDGRVPEAAAAAYAYQPVQGQVLRWEEGAVETTPARAGGIVNVAAQVALLGAAGTTPLTVRVRLVQGEKTIAELGAHTFLCSDGAWRCVQGLALPGNVPLGAYVLQVECATARAQAVGAIPLAVQ